MKMTQSRRYVRRSFRKISDFREYVENFKILDDLSSSSEDSSFEYSYAIRDENANVVEKRFRVSLIGRERRTLEVLWLLVEDSKRRSPKSYDPLEEFSYRFPELVDELKRNVKLEDTNPNFDNLTWLRQRY